MKTWEYKIFTVDKTRTIEETEVLLNGFGKDGWEFISSVWDAASGKCMVTCKREVHK